MKECFLKYLFFLFAAVSLNGCLATAEVGKIGKYSSCQVPERAVILRDGRVVVDFSEERWTKRGDQLYYYKRVYFEPDYFFDFKEPVEPDRIKRKGNLKDRQFANVIRGGADNFEYRIFRYVDIVNPDDEKGNWRRMAIHPMRLPPIPDSTACVYKNEGGIQQLFETMFIICNENDRRMFNAQVKATYDKEKREWWSYAARILYVPAVVFDIVTAPIQALVLLHAMSNFSMH